MHKVHGVVDISLLADQVTVKEMLYFYFSDQQSQKILMASFKDVVLKEIVLVAPSMSGPTN